MSKEYNEAVSRINAATTSKIFGQADYLGMHLIEAIASGAADTPEVLATLAALRPFLPTQEQAIEARSALLLLAAKRSKALYDLKTIFENKTLTDEQKAAAYLRVRIK